MFRSFRPDVQRKWLAQAVETKTHNITDDVLAAYNLKRDGDRVMSTAPDDRTTFVSHATARESAATFAAAPDSAFRPRTPGMPRGGADIAGGLPETVVPTKGNRNPKRPGPEYVPDPYTGGWKLDHDMLRREAQVTNYETRSDQFQRYVKEQDVLLDQELAKLQQRAAILRPGAQQQRILGLINKYQTMRAAWGEAALKQADAVEADVVRGVAPPELMRRVWNASPDRRQYFARQEVLAAEAQTALPGMINGLKAETQAMVDQFKMETQGMFVDAMAQYNQYLGLNAAGDAVRPEELRAAGMSAVTALDRLGSHLYANHSQDVVTPDIEEAFITAAKSQLEARGIAVSDDFLRTITSIPADRNGIQELLKIKTDLLGSLAAKQPNDLNLVQASVLAMRKERRYMIDQGARDPSRLKTLTESDDATTRLLVELRAGLTDGAAPKDKLRLAQQEAAFVKAFAPEQGAGRLSELDNRDPAAPGIIQQERLAQLTPLMQQTDALLEAATDSDGARKALAAVRSEGKFILRYGNELTRDTDARLAELVGKQHDCLRTIWRDESSAARTAEQMATAVASIDVELRRLQSSPANLPFLQEIVPDVTEFVRKRLRGEVNQAIARARTADKKNAEEYAATTESAVRAVAAEERVLTSLGMDPDRLASIRKERELVNERSTTTANQMKEVAEKKAPEGNDFGRLLNLIDSEERMLRQAFGQNVAPDRLQELAARRDAVFKGLAETVDRSVTSLNNLADDATFDRVRALVGYEMNIRGGASMTDTQRYTALVGHLAAIEKAHAAAMEHRRLGTPLQKTNADASPVATTTPGPEPVRFARPSGTDADAQPAQPAGFNLPKNPGSAPLAPRATERAAEEDAIRERTRDLYFRMMDMKVQALDPLKGPSMDEKRALAKEFYGEGSDEGVGVRMMRAANVNDTDKKMITDLEKYFAEFNTRSAS